MELSGTINRSITLSGSMIARGLDGRGIVSIAKTGTSGLVDTYTITYTDATTSTFTVTNGANGQITATSFAEEFSSSKAYAAGDYVVYSGQLYQFTTAHAAGAWNASHATAVQIADQVSELKSAITNFDTKYLDFSMVNRLDPSTCQTGKFINGKTGAISDNASYYVTNYMAIRPGETIQIWMKTLNGTIPMRTVAAYDKDKTIIDSLGTNTQVDSYTQSGSVAFIRASVLYNTSYFVNTPYGQIAVTDTDPLYIPGYGNKPVVNSEYFRTQIFVKATDTESQVIAKLVQAYNLANCDVHFERATYQFGEGLASIQTDYHLKNNEIPVGNNCRYYFNGATLTATIDLTQHPGSGGEEFYVNLLGTQGMPTSFEMYDGVLEATDTRYVMHDESSALTGSYKHLYQNMEMHYHTSTRAEVIRKALGGGTGASGVVEIIGCRFSTDAIDVPLAFHGNASDVVGAKFDLNIRNCWFSNGFRAGELSAHQTARLFNTGNSFGVAPYTSYERWTVTSFLNEVRT